MTEPSPNRRIQIVAVGFAVAALATALIAVIVVSTRSTPEPPAPSKSKSANTVEDHRVNATDVVKLDTIGTNSLWSMAPDGVRIDDAELRKSLGLERGDVITALSGHPIKRDRDVHRAVFDLGLMSTTTIYVEAIRDHDSVLLRWRVDGDLREARRTADSNAANAGGFGSLGGSGGLLVPPVLPPTIDPPDPDPLAATVRVIDDDHLEVPQTTVDQFFADPIGLMKGARVVPAVKNGHPDGFKLYAIRPSSLFAALHFQNGDTIRAINREDLTTMSQSLDVFTRLKGAKHFEIDLERRGKGVTLTIDIK